MDKAMDMLTRQHASASVRELESIDFEKKPELSRTMHEASEVRTATSQWQSEWYPPCNPPRNHASPRDATRCRDTPRRTTPRRATPYHATPRHATPRHANLYGTAATSADEPGPGSEWS